MPFLYIYVLEFLEINEKKEKHNGKECDYLREFSPLFERNKN